MKELKPLFFVVAALAGLAAGRIYEVGATHFGKSAWSEPVNLGAINTAFAEQNAFLSKDELTLYFTSDRPGGFGGLDIYVTRRASTEGAWRPAVNLGPMINTAANDFAPSLSIDGHLLFFASGRPGGHGATDIYVSRRPDPNDEFAWEAPVNLGPPINTADFEQAPFYLQNAEDGTGNLYFNRGAVVGVQRADIYYAAVARDGEVRDPEVFVAELNSSFNDFAVTVRKDGVEIFFASPRPGGLGLTDIWTSKRQSIHHAWEPPVNAGEPLNSAFNDTTPHLSFNGRTMIFATNRPGGLGANDLWMSTRTPSGH